MKREGGLIVKRDHEGDSDTLTQLRVEFSRVIIYYNTFQTRSDQQEDRSLRSCLMRHAHLDHRSPDLVFQQRFRDL